MSLELLKPIPENIINEFDKDHLQGSVFNKINLHTEESGLPDIDSANLCLIGIYETRNSYFESEKQDLNKLRKELYKLKQGKWKINICDLGDLPNGDNIEDTYHAIYDICKELYLKKITLVIMGGSNDIIYPIFKSFDSFPENVSIVSIDNQFDLYQDSDLISGRTYMNKIILDDSNKLNDFTNIGYQRHLCSHKEIDLMEKLFFEKISLGEILENNSRAEPIIRDADIVGFDMKSLSFMASSNPNGIDPRLACILSKYAGQSIKTYFFGLFDLNENEASNKLYSEIIWYFIDSLNNRINESNFDDSQMFFKYIVQTSGRDIIFYKSKVSERWWMTVNSSNNKTKFLSCLESDYKDALNNNIPNRWLKASKRT